MKKAHLLSKHGFTLLEVIVVMIIVGVLAAIAVPNLFRAIEKSHVVEALQYAGHIKNNLEPFIMQSGGSVCPSGTLLPNVYSIVDQVGPKQPQYFLAGTATSIANGSPPGLSINCTGNALVIFIDRNSTQAVSDPCQGNGSSSQCRWSACGVTDEPNFNSGIVLCRDDTGKWEIAYSGWYK